MIVAITYQTVEIAIKFKSSAVSHIQDFGDATTSPAGDAAFRARDAVWVWGMSISKGDLTSPVVNDRISRVWVPRLPLETRHLPREMRWHLQNLGYVTLLERLQRCSLKYNSGDYIHTF